MKKGKDEMMQISSGDNCRESAYTGSSDERDKGTPQLPCDRDPAPPPSILSVDCHRVSTTTTRRNVDGSEENDNTIQDPPLSDACFEDDTCHPFATKR